MKKKESKYTIEENKEWFVVVDTEGVRRCTTNSHHTAEIIIEALKDNDKQQAKEERKRLKQAKAIK